MVLAPEHPLIAKITTEQQKDQVAAYQKETARKSDLDRTELNLQKTGVFTGAFAINPVNEEKIPIWISDYVLLSYGTGAIMAVPAHDERDFEFAMERSLSIKPVYDPKDQKGEIRAQVLEGKKCWPGEGIAINSSSAHFSLNGMDGEKAKESMIQWLEKHQKGRRTTSYKLRDWLFSRQRYWGEPFPLLKFEDGSIRLLAEDELPLCPPEISNYKPSSAGESPLARAEDWVAVFDHKTQKNAKRETHIMPQWAGSCWYYLRFCDPCNDQEAWSPEAEKYWMPVDMYVGGVEHAVLHLLYARFWHKVLYDCGYVTTLEPFRLCAIRGSSLHVPIKIAMGLMSTPNLSKKKMGNTLIKGRGKS